VTRPSTRSCLPLI